MSAEGNQGLTRRMDMHERICFSKIKHNVKQVVNSWLGSGVTGGQVTRLCQGEICVCVCVFIRPRISDPE